MEPFIVDPLPMQYFQRLIWCFNSAYLLASAGVMGTQLDSSTKKEPIVASYMGDHGAIPSFACCQSSVIACWWNQSNRSAKQNKVSLGFR